MTTNNDKELNVEIQESEERMDQQLSSFELVWKLGFDELDAWAERFNKRDALFLEAARSYVNGIKRNQDNVKTISAQFTKELKDWEKAVREELLVTTTTMQHFSPIKSYEEINQAVEEVQSKTTSLLLTPIRALSNDQALDKYLETVDQYITFRKNGREKYIETVKKSSNVLYENQKLFVNLVSNQVKSAIFPFQKYMKNVSDLAKS